MKVSCGGALSPDPVFPDEVFKFSSNQQGTAYESADESAASCALFKILMNLTRQARFTPLFEAVVSEKAKAEHHISD